MGRERRRRKEDTKINEERKREEMVACCRIVGTVVSVNDLRKEKSVKFNEKRINHN
jgi:hypothetical protein